MALIGYARVSTQQQDLDDQIKTLKAAGCEKIFSGKHSGKAEENQAQLNKMLDYVREGDVVMVTKIDRLGRSLNQVLTILEEFKKQGIGFKALNQGIDTTKTQDAMTVALIQLLGLFAELERNFIIERTQEGRRTKMDAGMKMGRPTKKEKINLKKFAEDVKQGLSLSELSIKYKISKSTAQRYKKELEVKDA